METILIVGNDYAVQKALRRLFEYEGYRVDVSGDGQSALDRFRSLLPAAIILDLGLPVISGRNVCREIRSQSDSVPIIVVSALAEESDKVLLLELGANDNQGIQPKRASRASTSRNPPLSDREIERV